MLVNELAGSIGNSNNATTAPRGTQLTQDDFIKLLMTQMKLQTPQNPFDSNTMMQQMAQLTNLSASHDMESAVKSLNTNLGASQVLAASQLVGKKVQVAHQSSPLAEGKDLQGSVALPRDVDKLTVTISDMNDRVVKVIELGAANAGIIDFSWNGLDTNNNPSAPGLYKMSASAVINGETVGMPTAGTFNVNSVALGRDGEGVILNLDGIGGVNMKDLVKILS
ncbi:FlgD immunoglobulin-like domain containing protein [Legionella sp. CNM-4043-24]|uniref:FlgD immunoglobulin-like domain containing protein n=1 Tax=Legionella sp. CNM-4043-24 TaxID=3421646 RepID=UPI00403AD1D6